MTPNAAEARIAPQRAHGKTNVLDQPLSRSPPPYLAGGFPDQGDVAEILFRSQARLRRSQSAGGSIVRLFGEMKRDLVVELGFRAAPVPQHAKASPQL